MSNLRKATRQKAKLRLNISGPTGSGKTMTALLIAYGITGDWNKIAVIDTEHNSADLYADHMITTDGKKFTIGQFNVLPLAAPYSPERFIEAIEDCENSGMEVIIVDSTSHEWNGTGGVLENVDVLKNASNSKNAFIAGWSVMTPRHDKFIQKLVSSSSHIIGCSRSKMEYIIEENGSKKGPKKVGLAPIQREGVEYEYTIHLDLSLTHFATAQKDRSGLFADKDPFIPTVNTGKIIREWCDDGIDMDDSIKKAINKITSFKNTASMISFRDEQPDYIKTNEQFRTAANERYTEIVNELKKIAQPTNGAEKQKVNV